MQLGVMIFSRGSGGSREGLARIARAIEDNGYDYLALNDHVVVPRGIQSRYPYSPSGEWAGAKTGECLDILSTAAYVAATTERARILTSVMVVPHRPAVQTAKMLATIDQLSAGRLIVGCGAGWLQEEFEAIGVPDFEARGRVTDEYIEAFKSLWTEPSPSYQGEFVAFNDIIFEPKPAQVPHPPIWIGGESLPAIRRAVRHGAAWYPATANPKFPMADIEGIRARIATAHAACEAEGRDPASLAISLFAIMQVAFEPEPGANGGRRLMSGAPAELAEDLSSIGELGVGSVTLLLQVPDLGESVERIARVAAEVRPLVST